MRENKSKFVDVGAIDIERTLRALEDVKKQNDYLFDALTRLQSSGKEKKDKHFDVSLRSAFSIAANIKRLTEIETRDLQKMLTEVKDEKVDEKFLDKIASVNKPTSESIKYGQSVLNLRTSFLNMAVKRASEKSKEIPASPRTGE